MIPESATLLNSRTTLSKIRVGEGPILSCPRFEDRLDTEFKRFSDLDAVEHRRRPRASGVGFDTHDVAIDTETGETLILSGITT